MIAYISNSKIDRGKYDITVKNAVNTMIYAYSWYLDAVADDWDILILDDYKAVMPLPKRKKFGLNYIYRVPWIQQLGVFSNENSSEDLIKEFIDKIPRKYVLIDYYFNSKNVFKSKYLTKRTNYILLLNTGFDQIIKGFNTNRKRIIKKDFSKFVLDKKGDKNKFLDLYKNSEKKIKPPKDAFQKLQDLLKTDRPGLHIWNVYNENELLAGLFFLKDSKRITYLLPVATDKAKKNNIPSFIVFELIKEYQNTDYILDFEGSMAEGVAGFYKSFGAEREDYYHYKKKIAL